MYNFREKNSIWDFNLNAKFNRLARYICIHGAPTTFKREKVSKSKKKKKFSFTNSEKCQRFFIIALIAIMTVNNLFFKMGSIITVFFFDIACL